MTTPAPATAGDGMAAAQLPASVTGPLLQLLGWLAWLVTLLCIARVIWCAGLLALDSYRGEATEGLIGALIAGALTGSASTVAAALLAPP